MKIKLFLGGSLLFLVLFMAACGSQPAAPGAKTGTPVENYAGLMDALRGAGAAVEPGEQIEQTFFAVTGQIIKVNGADVQVFEYETVQAMEADAAQVAPDGGSIGTSMVQWIAAPHFYKTGRIIALYVGDDQAIIDLLKGALGSQFAGR